MPRKTFGDGSPIEGEPLDETCPECGSDVVRLADYTEQGSETSYVARCTNTDCRWRESRPANE